MHAGGSGRLQAQEDLKTLKRDLAEQLAKHSAEPLPGLLKGLE
jgi:hypothetical protein